MLPPRSRMTRAAAADEVDADIRLTSMMRRQYSGDSSRNGVIAVQPTVEITRSTVPERARPPRQQPVAGSRVGGVPAPSPR